jgi:HAMP domain-containing protein
MKMFKITVCVLVFALLVSLPLFAQRPASEERGGGGGSAGGAAPAAASTGSGVTSRGISAGDASAATGRTSAGVPSFGGMSTGGGTTYHPTPNLTGTSFASSNSYYEWQNFLFHLRMHYMINGMFMDSYALRFYRNREPLLTPQLMKLALRDALATSTRMVRAVEELEKLVSDLEAGKPVNKEDIALKNREVRDLARKIRQDNSLSFVDRRMEKDVSKDAATDQLGLTAVRQLRETVVDLHTQLKGMYSQSSTATVSVNSLSQPSFESLSKRIEKLSKALDTAVKRS